MRLVAESLSHGFQPNAFLFQNLSFELHAGEITAIVGPSGSGKSTILSLLAGTVRPTSGRIVSEGVSNVGWIFQNPIGTARRSVLDQVALPYLASGKSVEEARQLASRLLERFGVQQLGDRQFRHLSGGEAQRVGFARAVAARFDAILIDEPTAQLDPRSAATIGSVIRELADEHRIVLVATHDSRLRDTCDRVIDLGELASRHDSGDNKANARAEIEGPLR